MNWELFLFMVLLSGSFVVFVTAIVGFLSENLNTRQTGLLVLLSILMAVNAFGIIL